MLFALLSACTSPSTDDTAPPADTAADVCWQDLSPGTTVPLTNGLTGGTEGLAFVGQHLYVSVDDGVIEVLADGSTTPLTTTPLKSAGHALGLAPWDSGLALADPGEGTGTLRDPCSVYVTSLYGSDVSRVVLLAPGAPLEDGG